MAGLDQLYHFLSGMKSPLSFIKILDLLLKLEIAFMIIDIIAQSWLCFVFAKAGRVSGY